LILIIINLLLNNEIKQLYSNKKGHFLYALLPCISPTYAKYCDSHSCYPAYP
jgi:hypothetical protein